MADTTWLIGSYKNLPAQALTVNGGLQAITAGSRYLYHSTNALSLLYQVQAAITAAGVAGASVVILKNRKVRISANAAFTLDWPADNVLRNLLGFNANLAGQSSYTAASVSKYLWSPGIGRAENPELAPLGVRGHRTHAAYTLVSPYDGSTETVTHGSREYNAFSFPYVLMDRVQTGNEYGGEFVAFFDTVCVQSFNFNLWREVDEDGSSNVATPLSQKLGPYVFSPERRGSDWSFVRTSGLELVEVAADIRFRVHVVPEYS